MTTFVAPYFAGRCRIASTRVSGVRPCACAVHRTVWGFLAWRTLRTRRAEGCTSMSRALKKFVSRSLSCSRWWAHSPATSSLRPLPPGGDDDGHGRSQDFTRAACDDRATAVGAGGHRRQHRHVRSRDRPGGRARHRIARHEHHQQPARVDRHRGLWRRAANGPFSEPCLGGTVLSSMTALSYMTYRTSGGQMPTMNIEVSPPETAVPTTRRSCTCPTPAAISTTRGRPGTRSTTPRPAGTPRTTCDPAAAPSTAHRSRRHAPGPWAQITASYPNAPHPQRHRPERRHRRHVHRQRRRHHHRRRRELRRSSTSSPTARTTCFVNGATGRRHQHRDDRGQPDADDPGRRQPASARAAPSRSRPAPTPRTSRSRRRLTLAGARSGEHDHRVPALVGPELPAGAAGSLCAGAAAT